MPMPMTWKRGLSRLARWPALCIQAATIERGVACVPEPQPRFSPTAQRPRPFIQPVRAMRALKRAPLRESWAK